MRACAACGHKTTIDTAKFCADCGWPLVQPCPYGCGRTHPVPVPSAAFARCGGCERPLSWSTNERSGRAYRHGEVAEEETFTLIQDWSSPRGPGGRGVCEARANPASNDPEGFDVPSGLPLAAARGAGRLVFVDARHLYIVGEKEERAEVATLPRTANPEGAPVLATNAHNSYVRLERGVYVHEGIHSRGEVALVDQRVLDLVAAPGGAWALTSQALFRLRNGEVADRIELPADFAAARLLSEGPRTVVIAENGSSAILHERKLDILCGPCVGATGVRFACLVDEWAMIALTNVSETRLVRLTKPAGLLPTTRSVSTAFSPILFERTTGGAIVVADGSQGMETFDLQSGQVDANVGLRMTEGTRVFDAIGLKRIDGATRQARVAYVSQDGFDVRLECRNPSKGQSFLSHLLPHETQWAQLVGTEDGVLLAAYSPGKTLVLRYRLP